MNFSDGNEVRGRARLRSSLSPFYKTDIVAHDSPKGSISIDFLNKITK